MGCISQLDHDKGISAPPTHKQICVADGPDKLLEKVSKDTSATFVEEI